MLKHTCVTEAMTDLPGLEVQNLMRPKVVESLFAVSESQLESESVRTSSPQEADLVTTHELGHNFGAEHDPDDLPDCAPREDQGGKYVMYPIAVSGDHVNNKVPPPAAETRSPNVLLPAINSSLTCACLQLFSNCSKRSILKRLKTKAQSCFRERNINVCGNSRVEQGEECDPGLLHINSDHCCTADCKLKTGAQCR